MFRHTLDWKSNTCSSEVKIESRSGDADPLSSEIAQVDGLLVATQDLRLAGVVIYLMPEWPYWASVQLVVEDLAVRAGWSSEGMRPELATER